MLIKVIYWEFPDGEQTAFAEVKAGVYRCFSNLITPSKIKFTILYKKPTQIKVEKSEHHTVLPKFPWQKNKNTEEEFNVFYSRPDNQSSEKYISVNENANLLGSEISLKDLNKKFKDHLEKSGFDPYENELIIPRPIEYIKKQFPQEWAFSMAKAVKILENVEELAADELIYTDHRKWPPLFRLKWRWAFLKRSKKYRQDCDWLWNYKIKDLIEPIWLFGLNEIEEFLLSPDIIKLKEFGYMWSFFGLTLYEIIFFLDYEKSYVEWIAALIYFRMKSAFIISKGEITPLFKMNKKKWDKHEEIFDPKFDMVKETKSLKTHLDSFANKILQLGDVALYPFPLIEYEIKTNIKHKRIGASDWPESVERYIQCDFTILKVNFVNFESLYIDLLNLEIPVFNVTVYEENNKSIKVSFKIAFMNIPSIIKEPILYTYPWISEGLVGVKLTEFEEKISEKLNPIEIIYSCFLKHMVEKNDKKIKIDMRLESLKKQLKALEYEFNPEKGYPGHRGKPKKFSDHLKSARKKIAAFEKIAEFRKLSI